MTATQPHPTKSYVELGKRVGKIRDDLVTGHGDVTVAFLELVDTMLAQINQAAIDYGEVK